jgi:type III secretion protein V
MSVLLKALQGRQDLILIGLLMVTIMVMIVPLPTWLIDILIAANIALTVLIMVVAVYLKKPDDFTTFPAIILIATAFRLAISISTTRMILSQADAGAIVDTFGDFVTRGSVIVGLVIFLIITTVQFIVVTKGSERVAEVAARFTLDGLPGRQMSIDSELRSGDITPAQAQMKRAQLEKENQFFGAMDGAMKFVKGDAIAGLVVVAINLIGGITIGMVSQGLSAGDAVNVYSRLTVGDGLISQIPALIVAMVAGTIVTRVTSGKGNDLGTDIVQQLVSSPRTMYMAATLVFLIGLVPGFPKPVFFGIALGLAGLGYMIQNRMVAAETVESGAIPGAMTQMARAGGPVSRPEIVESKPGDALALAFGSRLHAKVDHGALAREKAEHVNRIISRFGMKVPAFGGYEDASLGANDFCIVMDGVAGFTASIPEGVSVVVCESEILEINGLPVVPLDSNWRLRSAYWVSNDQVSMLQAANAEVMSIEQLLARTVGNFLRRNIARMLGYGEVQVFIRELAAEHDNLATQISQSITAVQLLAIIRRLIETDVPLMPRRILFEALLQATITGGGTAHFVEHARLAMARQICSGLADDNRVIAGFVLEPGTEIALSEAVADNGDEPVLRLTPELDAALVAGLRSDLENVELGAVDPVLLTKAELRGPLETYLHRKNLQMNVMSFQEISSEFSFHPVGAIELLANNRDYEPEMAA